MTLRCSSVSIRTSSHWATLVSWNSSTSTCLNRPLQRCTGVEVVAEQVDGLHQQVVEVEGGGFEQAPLVLAVHVGDPLLRRRERPVDGLLPRHQLVLHRRDRARAAAGAGTASGPCRGRGARSRRGARRRTGRRSRTTSGSRAPAPRGAGCASTSSGTSTPTSAARPVRRAPTRATSSRPRPCW